MTVTGSTATGRRTPGASRAVLVLWVVVLANLAIVETIYFTSGPGKNSLLTVARFFGVHAAAVMLLQLTLVARVPWLDRRIGMDRLTSWHRWVGFTLFWTVTAHVTFILLGYSRLSNTSVLSTFFSLAGVTISLLGICAATILFAVVLVSTRFARRRMSYETWHALHVAIYATIVLAFLHQLYEGTTFRSSTAATVYWYTLWAVVGLAFLTGRVVLPLWRNAYHQFRVERVVPESDDVVSVHITGRHLHRLPARAGQFFIWRFPGYNRWWQANPFSLSAAPNGDGLRLTAKAVGTTSAGLRGVPVGTRVFVEGPYGAFTTLQQATGAKLLIAGGVGVTPIRALLEESATNPAAGSTGPVTVLYRVRSMDDAVLLAELQDLARERGAQLHLLAGRTGSGDPPVDPFQPESLRALVPDIAERDVYVCGPPAMTAAVLRSLRALKVPRRQIHAERFSLAG